MFFTIVPLLLFPVKQIAVLAKIGMISTQPFARLAHMVRALH